MKKIQAPVLSWSIDLIVYNSIIPACNDMSRADEILRLNQDLINPAVLQVGMEVTVYAR
jgi:prophage DNA circulation protein